MVVVLKISTLPRMILINAQNGIFIQEAGDGINIKGNGMEYNSANGISITNIGDNVIQSNEISYSIVGVKFNDDYLKPKNQDVSSNVIHHTSHVAVEAKDTYYYDYCEPLQIGDNWYADDVLMCPKVRSNNMKFSVTQIGPNQFQATFHDSKGNIASLLPDRTLTYQTNDGEIISMTISGGTGVFTVDAVNGDKIKATVDSSHRDNTYKAETKQSTNPTNGVTPTYEYPSIDYADSYDNYGGNGNGDGNGDGNGGNTNKGNGSSSHESGDNTGNSTHSQNTDPGSNSNTQINDVSQSYETQSTTSEASASQSSSGDASEGGSQSQSVVKQIIIGEEDIYRVTGISIIVALIILTIGLYYRDDIKEMNSKR